MHVGGADGLLVPDGQRRVLRVAGGAHVFCGGRGAKGLFLEGIFQHASPCLVCVVPRDASHYVVAPVTLTQSPLDCSVGGGRDLLRQRSAQQAGQLDGR